MNIFPANDALAHAHQTFRKNHDAGRQRLLETLSGDVSPLPATGIRSMRSIRHAFGPGSLSGRWASKLAVAATLLVASTIGLCVLWHGPEQAAYALEDLPNRLLEVKSLYLTGWMYQPEWTLERGQSVRTKYPLKLFTERPDCFWHTWYSFSGPDATHKDVRVLSGYAAGKGTKSISAFAKDKTFVETTVAAIENELATEMFLQIELPDQWLSGRLRDFTRTTAETVNGIRCDVYEHSSTDMPKSTKRVWLDPKSGLPVKIASYQVDKAGRETLTKLLDHVEVNIPASATGLSFDAPKGYQATKTPPSTAENSFFRPVASGGSGNVSLGIWHCFNIDDKAVLLALYCEPRSGAKSGAAMIEPEFLLGTARPCHHKEIASADVGGHHWNWSLVWPKQAGERIGSDDLSVSYRSKRGGVALMGSHAIRLREDRLRAILEEAGRLTKTKVPGSAQPFTLGTLRSELDKSR
jgi:hypothetical protein